MLTVKVKPMTSKRTGNPVLNQFTIRTPEGTYFQSYDAIIALISMDGNTYLDHDNWDYSKTTIKYLNEFLRTYGKKDIQTRIDTGEYKLTDLN